MLVQISLNVILDVVDHVCHVWEHATLVKVPQLEQKSVYVLRLDFITKSEGTNEFNLRVVYLFNLVDCLLISLLHLFLRNFLDKSLFNSSVQRSHDKRWLLLRW